MSDPTTLRKSVAAKILFERTDPAKANTTFLIVEGDSDAKFYRRPDIVDPTKCEVIAGGGKEPALKSLEVLEKQGLPGILCIVDADHKHLRVPTSIVSDNLLFTDHHDLETMLLQSPALEKTLAEFGSYDKYSKFGDIRQKLLEAALPIGYLVWISLDQKLGLHFEGLGFANFVDETSLTLDSLKLIEYVKIKSKVPDLDTIVLKSKISTLQSLNHDLWHVCRGHDLTEVLAIALRNVLGASQKTAKDLEAHLRGAYEQGWFRDTNLYKAIRNWENNNSPFMVLAA